MKFIKCFVFVLLLLAGFSCEKQELNTQKSPDVHAEMYEAKTRNQGELIVFKMLDDQNEPIVDNYFDLYTCDPEELVATEKSNAEGIIEITLSDEISYFKTEWNGENLYSKPTYPLNDTLFSVFTVIDPDASDICAE